MNVLCGFECSGVMRNAFRARGHNAWSCDLKPAEDGSPYHLQCDIRRVLDPRWDLAIFHPECTFMCNSGVKWMYKGGRKENGWDYEREEKLHAAGKLWEELECAPIKRMAFENPIPHEYARENYTGDYTQLVHPWQFGHREMKATCLWLWNLPDLVPTDVVGPPPDDPEERKLWARVHRMAPGPNRSTDRARTLPGIADAAAAQWGVL